MADASLKQLETLNEIGGILNRELDFKDALPPAFSRLIRLLGLTTGWVFLFRGVAGATPKRDFTLTTFIGLPPALDNKQQAPLCAGSCECQGMFRRGELDTGVNMVTCSRLRDAQGDTGGLKVHASIPLLSRRGPVGIMNLAADNTRFSPQQLAFLTVVGQQLGAAFERSRLQENRNQEVAQLAALEERQRLARDMHDSVTQLLFAADLALSSESSASQHIRAAHEAVQAALAELRSLVEVMRSGDLSRGLVPALARLAERLSSQLNVHFYSDEVGLGVSEEEALYRVAQEAAHNTLRHARARNLWLELRRTPRGISLSVRDDGTGFNPDQAEGQGSGLGNMKQRSAAIGGHFSLSAETGTLIRVEVPLDTARGDHAPGI